MRALIVRLLRKTEAGELDWSTGIDGETFTIELPAGLVYIYRTDIELEGKSGVRYQLDVCDHDGLAAVSEGANFAYDAESGALVDLYRAAVSSARGGERLLDEMLNTLAAA